MHQMCRAQVLHCNAQLPGTASWWSSMRLHLESRCLEIQERHTYVLAKVSEPLAAKSLTSLTLIMPGTAPCHGTPQRSLCTQGQALSRMNRDQ